MSNLDRLLGDWDIAMLHAETSEQITGRQAFEWCSRAFLLERWAYDHPDFPDAMAFLSEDEYHYFDVRRVIRVFEQTIDDAGWSMIRLDDEFSQRQAVRFNGPDAMAGTGERSVDGGQTWEHDFAIAYRRVS